MTSLLRLHKRSWQIVATAVLLVGGLGWLGSATGGSNVGATKHNLSKDGSNSVKATSETQVCAFCHTPHNSNNAVVAPLWNRTTNVTSYTRYTSASLDANTINDGFNAQPGGSSLLCLSCHDGTVALGSVNQAPMGSGGGTSIAMTGGSTMPTGLGANTGFTRNLNTDLTNDHPISATYNDTLAVADGELARMDANQKDIGTSGDLIGIRNAGYRPTLPLQPTGTGGKGQVQCTTCHDPHLDQAKFLRLNRLQANASPTGTFSSSNDIICIACHTKAGWETSSHADSNIADETYTDAAATLRGFPLGTKVWQASCLNCHDSHSVQGSRRLLRDAVGGLDADLLTSGGAYYRPGVAPGGDLTTSSAVENTCFQCHRASTDAQRIVGTGDGFVSPVKTLFELTYGMPIRSSDQADPNDKERHNITSSDLLESRENLGRNDSTARHAECPDCHNPHRLRRNSLFNSLGDASKRTHVTGSGAYGNVASGVLRGSWGVQPTYTTAVSGRPWPTFPDGFDVKKGNPTGTDTGTGQNYLTREYQLCFKCHSNYANGDTAAGFPAVGYAAAVKSTTRRGTPITYANGMQRYTNVAAEFATVNAPVDANGYALSGTDQGESTNVGAACGGTSDCVPSGSVRYTGDTTNGTINHRSWHPVMYPTGRDNVERGMGARVAGATNTNIRPPFHDNMGKQTMYCSDCHGQGSSYTPGVGPIATEPQGPHGSSNPFLLRGQWAPDTTKIGSLSGQICGFCHQPGSGNKSGFGTSHNGGGQGAMNNAPCMFCHIAVPHGWKNKAFLVNNNCVGIEGGLSDACNIINTAPVGGPITTQGSTSHSLNATFIPPYYNAAKVRITTWTRSGQWNSDGLCNGKDNMTSCGSSY